MQNGRKYFWGSFGKCRMRDMNEICITTNPGEKDGIIEYLERHGIGAVHVADERTFYFSIDDALRKAYGVL